MGVERRAFSIFRSPNWSVAGLIREDASGAASWTREDRDEILHGSLGAIGAELARHQDGSPYLVGDPRAVSVSHAGRLLVVGISENGVIGVDVEPLDRDFDAELFERYSLSSSERAGLPRFADRLAIPRREVVLVLWTLKEARVKAVRGPFVPAATSFDLSSDGHWVLPGSAEEFFSIRECGHIVSVCRVAPRP